MNATPEAEPALRTGPLCSLPQVWADALAGFLRFRTDHRGVSDATNRHNGRLLRHFAAHVLERDPTRVPEGIGAGDIDAFLIEHVRPKGRNYARSATSALRPFLTYLATTGAARADLGEMVPQTRSYRLEGVPRLVAEADARRVLDTLRRDRSRRGLRAYAVVALVATYGLRAGDVAALTFDNIQWRQRRIHIRMGKTGRPLPLPLVDAVGDGIARYARDVRGRAAHRHVFLTLDTKARPLTSAGVSGICRRALDDAGVPRARGVAAHAFRHGMATTMLRRGVALQTIADCLGHADTSTTSLYTKVSLDQLRSVGLDPAEVLP